MSKGVTLPQTDYSQVNGQTIAVITAEWNAHITHALRDGADAKLKSLGWAEGAIRHYSVPGAFELVAAASWLAKESDVKAVICLGCVIQGDTRHFEFICQAVAQGIAQLNIKHGIPVIFGVLTTDSFTQAEERAGGTLGNKGEEAADTAAYMLALKENIHQERVKKWNKPYPWPGDDVIIIDEKTGKRVRSFFDEAPDMPNNEDAD